MGSALSIARADGCPVDHENMSPEQIKAFMSQYNQDALPREHPMRVKEEERVEDDKVKDDKPDGVHEIGDGNKVEPHRSDDKQTEMFDVYGQKLDSANMMPATPNQLPSPGQKETLSTDRVMSTIPKSGNDGEATWLYPSPQMFFNALKRKGKASDVTESDVPTVVAVHNRMNEQTWKDVLQWEERFHCDECTTPKLKRFLGRPHDLSPVARFRSMFRGYPKPFDRHDWIVDRCGQRDVRYVIDYYYTEGPDPIEIHVRPALDSLSAAYDRFRSGIAFAQRSLFPSTPFQKGGETTSAPRQSLPTSPAAAIPRAQGGEDSLSFLLPRFVKGDQLDPEEFSFLTELNPDKISTISEDVTSRCKDVHEAFITVAQSPSDQKALEQANISLNYCMAQTICKQQAKGFMTALESDGDVSNAYANMTDCLDRFQIMARRAMLEAAGIEQSGPEFAVGEVPSVASTPQPAVSSSVEPENPSS